MTAGVLVSSFGERFTNNAVDNIVTIPSFVPFQIENSYCKRDCGLLHNKELLKKKNQVFKFDVRLAS